MMRFFVLAMTFALLLPGANVVHQASGSPLTISGVASWIAFSVNLQQSSVKLHWSADVSCGESVCYAVDQAYSEAGLLAQGEHGGVVSLDGSQTSVQLAGVKLVDSWVPDQKPASVSLDNSMSLSSDRYGNWTGVTILLSVPSQYHIDVSPPEALFDFHAGSSAVSMMFASDFAAVANGMQSAPAGLGAGVGAGVGLSATVSTTMGMLGVFSPWAFSTTDELREGDFHGPDGETGSCINTIVLGGCVLGFVLHGPAGNWTFDALHRVCACKVDEPWVFFVDQRPPAVP
jgi:hypothetical protein